MSDSQPNVQKKYRRPLIKRRDFLALRARLRRVEKLLEASLTSSAKTDMSAE